MKRITPPHSYFTRLLCFLLAFFFLNFSIDPADANPDSVPEDLSYNDIESFAELVAEEWMNISNAFAEHEERDGEEGGSFDFSKEFFSQPPLLQVKTPLHALLESKFHLPADRFCASLNADVVSPPPRG